jgi:hypothetical protein
MQDNKSYYGGGLNECHLRPSGIVTKRPVYSTPVRTPVCLTPSELTVAILCVSTLHSVELHAFYLIPRVLSDSTRSIEFAEILLRALYNI